MSCCVSCEWSGPSVTCYFWRSMRALLVAQALGDDSGRESPVLFVIFAIVILRPGSLFVAAAVAEL